MSKLLYLYGFSAALPATPPDVDGFDAKVEWIAEGALAAFFSSVDAAAFSQEAIDAHANDLAWLGEIGFAHQRVVESLSRQQTLLPVRAFTLFATVESLVAYVRSEGKTIQSILRELEGQEEWTVKLEIEPERWAESMVFRARSLQELQKEIESAPKGRAYLLQKKLADEKKKAAREAESHLVSEIAQSLDPLASRMKVESRESREGSFPQITLLLPKDRASQLQRWRDENAPRYDSEGVSLVLTGPWPPYSFTDRRDDA